MIDFKRVELNENVYCIGCQLLRRKLGLANFIGVKCYSKDLVARRFYAFQTFFIQRFMFQRYLVLIQRISIYFFIIAASLSLRAIMRSIIFWIKHFCISLFILWNLLFNFLSVLFFPVLMTIILNQHNLQRHSWIMSS